MSTNPWPPPGWEAGTARHGGHDHAYYTIDRCPEGTASVMLMHEFPGISQYLVELAEQLADHFRVVVPSIVGRDGDPGVLGSVAQLCVRREVHAFKTGTTSPAVPWLRHLLESQVSRGEPCGVIGMCLSGGFALALSVSPAVRAAVVAQPAAPASRLGPVPLPGRRKRAADLGLSAADRQLLSERSGPGPNDVCARGYRFAQDRLSPPEKLAAAALLMGEAAMTVVTLEEPDPTKHSTLTGHDRSDAAILEVIEFLGARLLA